jgi:hypothetical protein
VAVQNHGRPTCSQIPYPSDSVETPEVSSATLPLTQTRPKPRHPGMPTHKPPCYALPASSTQSAWLHPITAMYHQTMQIRETLRMGEMRLVRPDLCGLLACQEVCPYIQLVQQITHCAKLHNLTSPSPPPVAMFRPSSPIPTVAKGCHAAPPIRSVWPRFVVTAFRFGRSHTLASPVHDVVRTSLEFGENRIVDNGRSSPN